MGRLRFTVPFITRVLIYFCARGSVSRVHNPTDRLPRHFPKGSPASYMIPAEEAKLEMYSGTLQGQVRGQAGLSPRPTSIVFRY